MPIPSAAHYNRSYSNKNWEKKICICVSNNFIRELPDFVLTSSILCNGQGSTSTIGLKSSTRQGEVGFQKIKSDVLIIYQINYVPLDRIHKGTE